MTLAEDNGPERGGDDLFAAEYVLGVLPAEERQIASRRIDSETEFARLVDGWEVHLSPLGAVPYVNRPAEQPQARLVASLAADGSDVKYLAVYDSERHEVSLSHVSGALASGKDFELWMIEGKNAPVSMGV
ncbi:MAG: anti-sigma factor, partial [Mesorhizobium sp.]